LNGNAKSFAKGMDGPRFELEKPVPGAEGLKPVEKDEDMERDSDGDSD